MKLLVLDVSIPPPTLTAELLTQFLCHWLLTGGTVIPVSLIAVVPTVLEKSVFYEYLSVASGSLGLPIVSTLLFSNN